METFVADNNGPDQPRDDGVIRAARIDGIAIALGLKFGDAGEELLAEIRRIEDPAILRAIMDGIGAAATPEEVRAIYAARG